MAQEPAKTPFGAAEGTAEGLASIETSGDSSSGETDLDAAATEDRKPSLAERLRAEQRRGAVARPRTDEGKPADPTDQASAAGKPITRARRAAGPVQRRIAARRRQ